MIIKECPVITWLLNPEIPGFHPGLVLAKPKLMITYELLKTDLEQLKTVRELKPDWGLPELVMPSFKKVVEKSVPTFEKMMPDLLEEFGKTDECGILILQKNETLVYGFGGGQLVIWYFKERNGRSFFLFSAAYEIIDGQWKLQIYESILYDDNPSKETVKERIDEIGNLLKFVAVYVAVKKYGKVEMVVIPRGKFTAIEGTPLEYVEKKKVINQTGQEVIVMDSKWFKKIINDNDIPVRGYFRMQNKKNNEGERYKELIFIEPFIRHGYHRNAKIEEE